MLFAYCKEQCRRSKAKTNVRWTEGKQKRYCEQGVSRCHGILVVHRLAAKTNTVIYKVNRRELYCAVELPLSDYKLYGKQLATR